MSFTLIRPLRAILIAILLLCSFGIIGCYSDEYDTFCTGRVLTEVVHNEGRLVRIQTTVQIDDQSSGAKLEVVKLGVTVIGEGKVDTLSVQNESMYTFTLKNVTPGVEYKARGFAVLKFRPPGAELEERYMQTRRFGGNTVSFVTDEGDIIYE